MTVVGLAKLQAYKQAHGTARSSLDAWVREIAAAEWDSSSDIVSRFVAARCISNERVLFPIFSGEIVVDVKVRYGSQVVLVVRLGSSAESQSWRF